MSRNKRRSSELPLVSAEGLKGKKELELVQTNENSPVSPSLGEDLPPCCGGCRHFQAIGIQHGFCRRYPPTVVMPSLQLTKDGPLGIFPITLSANFCGEFQST